MDDNRITSNDFDYDQYTGGSSDTGGVTSGNFDYDVYSGSSAMEYLRQENERKRQERERAKKSEAELRREEYEKKFAGMSADEIFGMPGKKKKDEEDYSDFFDDDAAKREAERHEFKPEDLPKVENMMPGEDEPSSQPHDDKYNAGVAAAAEMIARQRIRLENEQERYHSYMNSYGLGGFGRHSYYRRRRSPLSLMLADRYTGGDEYEIDKAFAWYLLWFGIGAGLGLMVDKFMIKVPIAAYLIFGAIGGFAGAIVKRNGLEKMTLGEAVSSSKIEIGAIFLALIAALIIEFST